MSEFENERLRAAQTEALFLALFKTFVGWANSAGMNVDDWKLAQMSGNLLNPLGGECSFYEAACSLQRIAEMRSLPPAVLVGSFKAGHDDDDVLPCQLEKKGQATLVIWARWDGQEYRGPDVAHPDEPAVLVSLEGCGPELGKWTDPVKLYALLEYGFQIGPYTETTDASATGEQDIPF